VDINYKDPRSFKKNQIIPCSQICHLEGDLKFGILEDFININKISKIFDELERYKDEQTQEILEAIYSCNPILDNNIKLEELKIEEDKDDMISVSTLVTDGEDSTLEEAKDEPMELSSDLSGVQLQVVDAARTSKLLLI